MSPIDGAWCSVEEHGARLYVRWGGASFDAVKADFRRTFWRHQDAVYLPKHKAWSVPATHRTLLQCWVSVWFAPAMLEWDDTPADADEEPAGGAHDAGVRSALAEAYRALYLTAQAPPWAVDAVYRAASKHLHPDHGGSHDAMAAVNSAVSLIRRHAERTR